MDVLKMYFVWKVPGCQQVWRKKQNNNNETENKIEEEGKEEGVMCFFRLLSHPHAGLSCMAYRVLSLAVCDRAQHAELPPSLSDSEKLAVRVKLTSDEAQGMSGEQRREMEENRTRSARLHLERQSLQQQASALLPLAVWEGLRMRMGDYKHRNQGQPRSPHPLSPSSSVSASASSSMDFASFQRQLNRLDQDEKEHEEHEEDEENEEAEDNNSNNHNNKPSSSSASSSSASSAASPSSFDLLPTALKLRVYLLCWSLVLDVYSCQELSSEKKSIIVQYIREFDLSAPMLNEVFEHLTVNLTPADLKQQLQALRAKELARQQQADEQQQRQQAAQGVSEMHTEGFGAVQIADDEEDEDEVEEQGEDGAKEETGKQADEKPEAKQTVKKVVVSKRAHANTEDITSDMCQPALPLSSLQPSSLTRRWMFIRRHHLPSLEEHCFYGAMCVSLYLRTLRTFPALSRGWWMTCHRSVSAAVSSTTSKNFSPIIIEDEIRAASADSDAGASSDNDEFVIRGHLNDSQLTARYGHGEIRMTLTITLPKSYPLQPVMVDFSDTVAVAEPQLRKWQRSIAAILGSQNGQLREAVMVWKTNLDKHFQGVEECPICYAIVHAQNKALPRMKCKTCNNHFHSQCLFKWFNSSGKSNCPMCRSLF